MKYNLRKHTDCTDEYIRGPDCERSNRHSTTCRKLQQGVWLHIKLYMAASNQFTEIVSTARNRQPRSRANDLLTPTNQRGRIPSRSWPNRDVHSTELDTKTSVLVLPNHQHMLKMGMELVPKMVVNCQFLTQLSAPENFIVLWLCGRNPFWRWDAQGSTLHVVMIAGRGKIRLIVYS